MDALTAHRPGEALGSTVTATHIGAIRRRLRAAALTSWSYGRHGRRPLIWAPMSRRSRRPGGARPAYRVTDLGSQSRAPEHVPQSSHAGVLVEGTESEPTPLLRPAGGIPDLAATVR